MKTLINELLEFFETSDKNTEDAIKKIPITSGLALSMLFETNEEFKTQYMKYKFKEYGITYKPKEPNQ